MKTISLLCLFLSSLCARADTVITESLENRGRSMTMTLKIKGDKIRMDASPQMSTITDTSTGDTVTILHPQKSYMRMSGEKKKAMMEQMKSLTAKSTAEQTPAEKPRFADTGKSEKVGSFDAEIYTLVSSTTNLTFWVTKDIPNYVMVQDQLRKYRTITNLGAAATFPPDTGGMQGLPVKTQIVNKGQTTTITILSVEEKPIDETEMAPPAGYTEISMPGAGGAGASKRQP